MTAPKEPGEKPPKEIVRPALDVEPMAVEGLKSPEFLKVIPEAARRHLGMKDEEFTFGYFVDEYFRNESELDATLDAGNHEGKLLAKRFGVGKVREIMPGAKDMGFVPISDKEAALYKDREGSREAAACMGIESSIALWYFQSTAGDVFSGPHDRIPLSAKFSAEDAAIFARTYGYPGIALHTWLDVHPDNMRAFSLNLQARDVKINSAFHGAFHGPIFGKGAMSSEFREVRHLAGLLKAQGQLMSHLGWDMATAIEEALIPHLGANEIEKLRGRVRADLSDDVVGNALKDVKAGTAELGYALKSALKAADVKGNVDKAVDTALDTVVDKPACAEVCDWDGTDGELVMEEGAKSATLLGIPQDQLRPTLNEYLKGEVEVEPGKRITRMELLAHEKAMRLLMTRGKGKIKIEPKHYDPSKMTEADVGAVIELADKVEDIIKGYLGAQIMAENPEIKHADFENGLGERYKPYEGSITAQIERGHAVQLFGGTASVEVERALHAGIMAKAFHNNWSPSATSLGDPDYSCLADFDAFRLQYMLTKAGKLGETAKPEDRIVMEYDIKPSQWCVARGNQGSREAVNVTQAQVNNALTVEESMRKTTGLTDFDKQVQSVCGTLEDDQGIFQIGDVARMFNIWSFVSSMPLEGLEHIPVEDDARAFREAREKPYLLDLPTRQLEKMIAAA